MSQLNIEIVRRILSRINDHDLGGALADVAPEALFDWSGSQAPDSGVYSGRGEWRKWISGRWEGLSEVRFEEAEVIDVPPDRVVTVGHLRGRGSVSGAQAEALGAAVWTLRRHQVTALTVYQTRDEALEAVGLKG